MSKIVNINTTSTKEEQLKDLITSIQQVKDSLVNILDEYEEDGEADKAMYEKKEKMKQKR